MWNKNTRHPHERICYFSRFHRWISATIRNQGHWNNVIKSNEWCTHWQSELLLLNSTIEFYRFRTTSYHDYIMWTRWDFQFLEKRWNSYQFNRHSIPRQRPTTNGRSGRWCFIELLNLMLCGMSIWYKFSSYWGVWR